MKRRSMTRLLLVILSLGLFGLATAGCGGPLKPAPVAMDRAQAALRTALESWKKGDSYTALQSQSPPIFVIDPDWEDGRELQEYQLLDEGEAKDAHMFCRVRLVVRTISGTEQREVTYVVSTAPNLTVSRKLF